MPKTLLVDTNRASYPIYKALCSLKHEVWVVGGNPLETLAKYVSNYVQLDYSDVNKLDHFVTNNDFDFIVPGCTDVSYESCSTINNGRFPGIDPLETTQIINTKSKFRKIAGEIGIPVPRVLSEMEAIDFDAVIIKPIDSYSGRGITTLHRPDYNSLSKEYENVCRASKCGQAIIEEFIPGQLFSHSAFIINNKIISDFIVQEDCIASPYAVDTSRVIFDFPLSMLHSLRENMQNLAEKLRLNDGLLHSQFIFNKDRYWVIETTRRCPGDIYSLLIEFSTSYPYAANYMSPFIGGKPALPQTQLTKNRIIRHTASPSNPQPFFGIQFSHPVAIHLFVPLLTSGENLKPGPDGRTGIFFFTSNSDAEHDFLYQTLINKDLYKFQ